MPDMQTSQIFYGRVKSFYNWHNVILFVAIIRFPDCRTFYILKLFI